MGLKFDFNQPLQLWLGRGCGDNLVKITSTSLFTMSVSRISQLFLDKPNNDNVFDTNSSGFHLTRVETRNCFYHKASSSFGES